MDALNPASFLANAFGLIQINLGGGSLRFGQIDGDGRAVAAPIDSDPIASFKFAEEMGVHAQALWTQQRFSRITPRLFLKNYSFDDGRHDGVSARTITASERFDSLLGSSVAIHSCQKEGSPRLLTVDVSHAASELKVCQSQTVWMSPEKQEMNHTSWSVAATKRDFLRRAFEIKGLEDDLSLALQISGLIFFSNQEVLKEGFVLRVRGNEAHRAIDYGLKYDNLKRPRVVNAENHEIDPRTIDLTLHSSVQPNFIILSKRQAIPQPLDLDPRFIIDYDGSQDPAFEISQMSSPANPHPLVRFEKLMRMAMKEIKKCK